MTLLPRLFEQRLREIYSSFRDPLRKIPAELDTRDYPEEIKDIVEKQDKAFTDFYHSVDNIQASLGKLLDDYDKGKFD